MQKNSSTARQWWREGWLIPALFLLKYWLEVTPQEQERRLRDRIDDGRKNLEAIADGYKNPSTAGMTTPQRAMRCLPPPIPHGRRGLSPVRKIKKRVRLNIITHLLSQIPYESLPTEHITLPKRKIGKSETAPFFLSGFIPEKFLNE